MTRARGRGTVAIVALKSLRRLEPVVIDRVLAAVLAVAVSLEVALTSSFEDRVGVWLPAGLVMALAIAWRRRHPLAVAVLVTGADGVAGFLSGPPTSVAIVVAWIAALYGLAVWASRAAFVAGTVWTVGTIVLVGQSPEASPEETQVWLVATVVALPLVRLVVRRRELRAEDLLRRAELLEREQELRAREAAVEERARIARELHDIVGHSVSVMVVQAGAERRVLPPGLDSTRDALVQIEQTGRQALAEMRRLLGMLRRRDEPPELAPPPGLARLETLVDGVREAGLPVELRSEGDPVPLPPGLDLTAYRIVQEGLTNILKHAGRARAQVLLRYEERELQIEIADDGAGPSASDLDGHGLAGIRERVLLHGGDFEARARNGRGFTVRVRLPLGA